MPTSQSSNNIASVAFAALNRFFHPAHPAQPPAASHPMSSAASMGKSPISPTYSDTGSGFSAPSPSPFSSSSASTSATSYTSSTVSDYPDYHSQSGSFFDYSRSEAGPTSPTEVDGALANLQVYTTSSSDMLAGHPGGANADYPAFASVHQVGNAGAMPFTPSGEIVLASAYPQVMTAEYSSSNTQNDCNKYISWSPKNPAQNLPDGNASNAYQQPQQQGQHIADATSTSTNNNSVGGGGATHSSSSSSSHPSSAAPATKPNGPYSSSATTNLNASNGPAKPSMLGPLYIPQSVPTSSSERGVPIHSPVPSRYADSSVVSGGQPHPAPNYPQAQALMPQQSQFHFQHHQRHLSNGSTGSNGGHPVLFDVDLDEWRPPSHQQSSHMRYPSAGSASVSPPQMYHQPNFQQRQQQSYGQHPSLSGRGPSHPHAQNLHLNLSINTNSPSSSLSSLSPGQMSMPLTPGHEFGHGLGSDYGVVVNGNGNGLGLAMGGPSSMPLAGSSPVVGGPASYPGFAKPAHSPVTVPSSSQAVLNQKRANLGLAQPSTSSNPASLSPTSRQHPHPYAQGYHQRSAHGRPSPLHPHQMQQARRSPLHQEYFDATSPTARNGTMNPGGITVDDDYAGQYEKMYRRHKQQERSVDKMQRSGANGIKQTIVDQRRHSAPLMDNQRTASQDGLYRTQPSPAPMLLGEVGRRPSAPATHRLAQHQSYGQPNNGVHGPALSSSPSSVSSSRSVPVAPTLSASSSLSSNSAHSSTNGHPTQVLAQQHFVSGQHDSTRLLSDMINSGSMTCIPGSLYDEDGINSISEGVDLASMMQLEIEEKIASQQHQPSFDLDLNGMELMDVDAGGMGMDIDLGMESVMRMNMGMSMQHPTGLHSHSSSSDTTASGSTVFIPPMDTVDMNDLTDARRTSAISVNQGISPSMMMLDDGSANKDVGEQGHEMFDFENVLDSAPSPTLVGGVSGVGVVQDWQKAGGEYDSADSSESDSEGEGDRVMSDVDAGVKEGKVGNGSAVAGGKGVAGGAVKPSGGRRRRPTSSTASTAGARKTGSRPTMKRSSTRTITSRSTRSKASTQTLTQRKVDALAGQVDSGIGEDEDADADADGEDDLGEEGEMAVGEEVEDEDSFSSSDESYDYDDDKDGEFVLRSRSRSKGATVSRSTSRRNTGAASSISASAPVGGRARASGGRSLRSRGSGGGRYNPYSIYAASVVANASNGDGSPTSTSSAGLRTLNAPGTASNASERSVSPSVCDDDGEAGEGSTGKKGKVRPSTSLPVPVPVPNLTKKSRGRRVPTVSSLEELRKSGSTQGTSTSTSTGRKGRGASGTKGTRMYLCDVEGCGKCFARGEHLKRHVRSIHTNEKPHTCPYPGCGKEFSRHDNLGQHMRVHKDYVPPPTVKA